MFVRDLVRSSVGIKIFSIAALLLLLAGGVAWINAHQARQVRTLIDNVATAYAPAYGALARTNIRFLEEVTALRGLMLLDVAVPTYKDDFEHLRAVIDEKARETDLEIAAARKLIQHMVGHPSDFGDKIDLAQLDTRLELMQADRRNYGAMRTSLVEVLEKGDRAGVARLVPPLDELRDQLNDKTERARHTMMRLLDRAAHLAETEQERAVRYGIILLTAALALGLVVAFAVTVNLVRPLRRLLGGATAVQGGALETELPVTSRDEVGQLTTAFNAMVRELRAKAQIRETFGRYVDPRIVEGLIDRPDLLAGKGDRRVMTVFFCDMKGFTSLSEGMTPAGMVNVVNRYLAVMSEPIRQHGGIIDKYIGDSIMAFWGPPFSSVDEQAALACAAALDQLARLESFRDELPDLMGIKRGVPHIDMRIGIATGEVVVGNIGSAVSMSYTVMGDTVNLASRIEGANKTYDTRLLISAATADRVRDDLVVREIDSLLLVGKQEPERVFELLGRAGEIGPERLSLVEQYEEGLVAYRRGDWKKAEDAFRACLEIAPEDGPARTLLSRVAHLASDPPPPDWKGVWSLTEK
jgi:class 3 adenylate cyclase